MSKSKHSREYRDRIYDEYVSSFKGHPSPERMAPAMEKHARVFDHLLQPVMAAGRCDDVLEVACGQGHFLYWAKGRGFKSVVGFDLSAEQVEVAKTMGLPAEVSSFQEYLARYHEAFDLIVGLDIIEHLTRDEAFNFLELCRSALRPQGHLFLTTPNAAGWRMGPVAYGDLTHETIFSPQTVTLALRMTGYDSVRVREVAPPPVSLRARVRGAIWRFLRLWPMFIDMVETGGASTQIYSRVMSVHARRLR